MKAQEQPKPQQINNNRFQITEEIVEEVVAIPLVYDNVLE